MKKYIFNLFPNRDKQPEYVLQLAMLISLYNFEQPENEFINWLINNLPEPYFIFYSIGKDTTKDGEPHSFDVQLRDEFKRVGTIEVINIK